VALSKDPAARDRQLANLRPANLTRDAALKHGGRAETLLQPRADELLTELQQEFPAASERTLRLQARRLAKLERLGAFLEAKGELRNKRSGEIFPASQMEESLTAAFLATQAKLEAQAASARGVNGNGAGGLEALRQRGAAIADGQVSSSGA
jgi:hypothetical protein